VAAGAALGAVTALPSGAVAGVPAVQDDIMASAATLDEVPARIQAVVRTRAKVARFDIFWSEVAPTRPANPVDHNDPAYDWRRADLVINGFASARITPIISVYSTPAWAVQGRNRRVATAYNPNAPRAAEYARFMRAVAARYRGKARHFEIWNEPNLKAFLAFRGRASLPGYKGLVRASYPAIKQGNPRAIVIAGVGGPRSSTGDGSIGARQWMLGLVNDPRVRFDAYSQHIYPARGPRFRSPAFDRVFPSWASLPFIYEQLDRKKKGMKLYVTEAGYTTAATPFRNVQVTPAVQNAYLRQLFNLPAVRSPRLAAVVWFNLQDNPNWPAGLLFADGRPKPSYASFRRIASRPIPGPLRSELSRR
jgi:hypothetical protein